MPKKSALPGTFEHPTLGLFRLDRRTSDYIQPLRLGKQKVELMLNCGHEPPERQGESLAACARVAARCLADAGCFVLEGAQYAADKLLARRNREWLGEGERPLSRFQFLSRIRLQEITVDREGGALWFDDGDVFWGHVVIVRFGPRGGFYDASVEG